MPRRRARIGEKSVLCETGENVGFRKEFAGVGNCHGATVTTTPIAPRKPEKPAEPEESALVGGWHIQPLFSLLTTPNYRATILPILPKFPALPLLTPRRARVLTLH